jgi:phosphoribosylanthranilate isomerase
LRVGLFVSPAADDVARVLDSLPLDVLQIYAPEPDLIALKARFGLPVWRTIGVAARADLPDVAGIADALLVEAKPPKDATRPGGNAVRFDWTLTQGWQAPVPWLLAGGLTPENVAEAVRTSGAAAVDVASGVESAPGVKDPARIRAFVAAARAA